jgi:hypothetical protein
MTKAEAIVLGIFRRYRVDENQMLFFNAPLAEQHRAALARLITRGYLACERRPHAFHLTTAGFTAMRNLRAAD